ncbi:MurR/RpiR family transcriptional regulator [Lactobacillus paragasseri]|uniref:SIS domain protein n=1 Tax=Lactobacillus paragasseri JV-V03 TaxID=525326 RepID=A0AA87A5E6_9LACO|nr:MULTISPECIES: MurR/RpiR family transcriptional regulator [Lactobacillus]EFJ70658.1 SIS domain protein [Lactobacillus paragasseri JV-V03]MDE3335547.1 MurR/RpiR family transcriptional regulator [Lactobacillus paragasseri]MDE3399108.1 MurR/RpiR family transcriptional regulator [Lactobacillus paragasseri]MDK7120711.1 MurR/RpiR family transcriptional regulator [Lactobacillus paragasseri]MDU8979630.1 MurR/RpiR family transcriptional regulator [Lactobacillus paragasseri]
MLIKDQLREKKNMSNNEKIVANYLLKADENIEKDTVRTVAEKTYTSPSTIIRLCHKLGFTGFSDFKNKFLNEVKYFNLQFQNVDVNFPFRREDTAREVMSKITDLYIETIKDTEKVVDMRTLLRCRKICSESEEIHIFSYGTYLNQAYSFKEKMMKIGKKVMISSNLNYQLYEAEIMQAGDIAIIISYSGETNNSLLIAKQCRKNNIPTIAITSIGENDLTKICDETLYISTKESLYKNIGDYSIHLSVSYVLDVLYSLIFQNDFEHFYETKMNLAMSLEKDRRSSNSIIDNKK